MTDTYRTLLVGTGGIGVAHVHAVASTSGRAKLVAAVDIDESKARSFCATHGIASCYTDFHKALREVRPNLVLIAAPPEFHAEMSIASMEAGAWVLCEKPLCRSLADADRIANTAQQVGRQTACVFQMRFASSAVHMRRLIASGALGRCMLVSCNTLWYRDSEYYGVPWRGRWETDFGGPTVVLGIHAMDLILSLLGDWAEVRAMTGTLGRAIETEDLSMALVRFECGTHASIINSALSPRQESYLRFDFEHATVELTHLYSFGKEHWRITSNPTPEGEAAARAWASFPEPDQPCSHGAQLTEFLNDIENGRAHATSGTGARNTVELITAIYKAAHTGNAVMRGCIHPGEPFYASLHGGTVVPRWGAPPAKK